MGPGPTGYDLGAPLRILHVVPTLSIGGAEKHLVDLVRRSDPERLEHVVCVLQRPHALLDKLATASASTVTLDLPGKHPWIRGAAKIRSLVRAHRPDVIHTWLLDADVSARLATLMGRRPPLVTGLQAAIYEPDVVRLQGWSPGKIRVFRGVDRWTARLTGTAFVGISEYVVDSYRRHFGLDPADVLAVIPNAIETRPTARRAPDLRHELGISEDALVVVSVGRLDRQKGHDVLLRAFAEAFAADLAARLVIFGDGSMREELTKLVVDLGLADRVLLPGARPDVAAAYAMADLFAFPSLHEGLGMAIIEAMASGVACVGSDIPPLREVLGGGKYGRLVPPMDVRALAETLRALAADPRAREQVGRAGEARARDYMFETTMPRWEQLYESVAR